MTLKEWDITVAPPLRRVESYSHALVRAVNELPSRPDFKTKAEDAMSETERVLIKALADVRTARKNFAKKDEAA